MKKKIWLVIIFAIGITWFVLANKFEDAIRTTYLPLLQEQQEKGLVTLDPNNIKIHKYRFTIVGEDFTAFPESDLFKTKLDKISVFYNPITRNVSFCSSGEKLSFGSNELEVSIVNPSFSFTINKSFLKENKNNFHISLNSKAQELLSSTNNAVLVSDNGSSYEITGNLDEKTNQYSLKLTTNTKGTNVTRDYFKWSNQLANKLFEVTPEDQKMTDFVNDFSADYYYIMIPGNSVDSETNFTINANRNHLENIYKLIKGQIQVEEFASNLIGNFDINKELFDITMAISYGNNLFNNTLSFNLSGDGKELKGNLNLEDTKNYPQDKILEITQLTSELLEKVFSKLTAKNTDTVQELTVDDFTALATSIVNLKNTNFSTNVSYKIQESDLNANLHLGINEYDMNLSIHGKNQESYTGILTLSDPFKLINAKTQFAHEVVLPLAKKVTDNKLNLAILQQYVSNLENNGFEALKVLSKNPTLGAGDKFETDFSFELRNFDFRINDKSFLEVITNEKIVKFLSGFSTEPTQNASSSSKIPQEESVSTEPELLEEDKTPDSK
ncbi:MAG: hypothetical protein AB8B68_01420 [Rickettsiaceae bacterium]